MLSAALFAASSPARAETASANVLHAGGAKSAESIGRPDARVVARSADGSSCKLPEKRPYQEYAQKLPLYDTKAFVKKVKRMMGDHFMGYAVALQDRQGGLIAAVNYGWARTPCAPDGQMAFSNNTSAPWGSVSKFITATAVMRKTERRPNRRSLEDRALDYLPPAWRDGVSAPYRSLTIGNLIQHRSGFKSKAPVVAGKKLSHRERLAQDPPERKIGASRKYANINYGLFDSMPKFLRGRAEIDEPSKALPAAQYDEDYRAQGAKSHAVFLKEQVFGPIGAKFSCNDALHDGKNYARNYNGPKDKGAGYRVNQKDEPGCAVGGVVISPAEMLKFLYAVSRTDKIVSRETWALMARPGDERYGLPQVAQVRKDFSLGGQYNHGFAYGHNGSRWGGTAKAQFFVFPNGMSAVAVVNSKGSEGAPGLKAVLLDAYDKVIPD